MNKKIFFLPFLLLALAFASCNETKEVSRYDNWQVRNEAFIDSLQAVVDLKSDPLLKSVVDQRDKSQTIFFKVLEAAPDQEAESPKLTSTVKVYYRGMLIDEEVFAMATSPRYYTKYYENLPVFDSRFSGADPSEDVDVTKIIKISTDLEVSGWIEILQWMKPGDRWEVYIPYKSAYGESGGGTIPGYSTLIFDMKLVSFEE